VRRVITAGAATTAAYLVALAADRRPSRPEVDLCRSHLDRQLALLKPDVLILVGGLAHDDNHVGLHRPAPLHPADPIRA